MLWQHLRYRGIRRQRAEDRQPIVYGRNSFHVVTFFRVREGRKVVQSARAFCDSLAVAARPRLIYAGQARLGVDSAQLGSRRWDGVVLVQYPSRSLYEVEGAHLHLRATREHFADCHLHGMRRDRWTDFLVPQRLLATRARDFFTGRWRSSAAAEPQAAFDTAPEFAVWRQRQAHLEALHAVNPNGLVLFTLLKHGGSGLDKLDAHAQREIRSHMAASAYGILHMGRAVALHEEARFDRVLVIFCPSAHDWAQLVRSRLFHRLLVGTGLSDTFAVPSVPITSLLEQSPSPR